MNTRQAIQPSNTPNVLSVSYSSSRNRFIAGLSIGVRVLRSDNCLPTYSPSTLDPDSRFSGGIGIAEALDDRYIAFVSGGQTKEGNDSVLVFWDCILEKEIQSLNFGEQVKGVRLSGQWLAVVLETRSVVFGYRELRQEQTPPPDDDYQESEVNTGNEHGKKKLCGPNGVHGVYPTSDNPFSLAVLRNDLLVLPAQSVGQIQLIPLPSGSKRVFRAHNTELRCLALSQSGNLLATASQQGTLIRIFNTKTTAQIAEFRRGVEKAIVYSLAFSDGERWLACTSDKGTVHVFDLRPPPPGSPPYSPSANAGHRATSSGGQQHRKSSSHPPSTHPNPIPHHLSTGQTGSSTVSGRSSPSTATNITQQTAYQGSIQEYYGLRPPPVNPSSPPALTSTMQAIKDSPWAPKVLKDVRSVAHANFMMGNEDSHWQLSGVGGGGASHTWTTAPDGTRRRVRNVVPALPAEPGGKAVKGIVAFAPGDATEEEESGVALYVVGGGVEGRWECFDLLPKEGGGWVLVRRGWRGWLGRQFVE